MWSTPRASCPTTYPRSWEDTPFAGHPERYPGTDEGAGYPVLRYSEGLQMGYRWYQSRGIAPLFPFGHGLSYTTFALSDLALRPDRSDGTAPLTVELTVTNTGDRAGAEVAQVYLGMPASCAPAAQAPGRISEGPRWRRAPRSGSA